MQTPRLDSATFPDRSSKSGFTLLEMMTAVVILGVLLGTVGSAMTSLQGAISEGTVTAVAEETSRRVLEKVVAELRQADLATLVLAQPADARSMTYSVIEGWNGTTPAISTSRTLSFASGQISLDGSVISGEVSDLIINLDGSLLTVFVEVQKVVTQGGNDQTIVSQLTARIRL